MTQRAAAFDRVIAGFRRSRVLVVGDVMLDRFLMGDVHRINPEAPVPILRPPMGGWRCSLRASCLAA